MVILWSSHGHPPTSNGRRSDAGQGERWVAFDAAKALKRAQLIKLCRSPRVVSSKRRRPARHALRKSASKSSWSPPHHSWSAPASALQLKSRAGAPLEELPASSSLASSHARMHSDFSENKVSSASSTLSALGLLQGEVSWSQKNSCNPL